MGDREEATILDDLSGYEFEDVMADVFRNLGYRNVRKAERVADKGRDILMEETVDGGERAVVVECKHTDTVGRPVVQKLHSAVATYDYDGPARGIVATTGRFTGPAREYVTELRGSDDPCPIDLVDGSDLREMADEVGLDLYNGRIEILCDRTLRPYDPTRGADAPLLDAVGGVENVAASEVPDPELWVTFAPCLRIEADVDAVFETGVGVIHQVHESETLVVRADRDGPSVPEAAVQRLVADNLTTTVDLDAEALGETFDEVSVRRFGRTETGYREWATERLCRTHTRTVQYTGDNNVTYTQECEPSASDVTMRAISPVYLPRIRASVELGEYAYPYEYYAAGPSVAVLDDGVHRCVQCGDADDTTYTYCENCGSINCRSHTRTERLEGDPVCTGCAVTERFFLRRKYFYDDENLETFRKQYEAMPLHRKALENRPLVAGAVLLVALVVLSTVVSTGVV